MFRCLVKTALTLATIAGIGSSAVAASLTWGEHLPACCSMHSEAAEWFKDEVAKRSNGELKIEIQYGGVLASVTEIPTAIETNVIDMGDVVTPYFPDQFVINNALSFFWPQPKSQAELGELMLKWYDEIPAFDDELARFNLKAITIRPLANYGILCRDPIRTLEDFKGKRIRAYGVALPAMLEALGAVPISMAEVEAYEALRNDVFDCSAADIALVDAFKWNEVAPYFIDVPMGATWGMIIAMNLDKYNALSDEHKKLLESLKKEHLTKLIGLFSAKEAELRQKWKQDKSVEIITLPAKEFLEITLGDSKVQAVRNSWKERAIKAGMPETDAERVVNEINN